MFNRSIAAVLLFIMMLICVADSHARTETPLQTGKPSPYGAEQRPVLTVTPREIDFGGVHPGETAMGDFSLKNIAPGALDWSAFCPEDWEGASRALRGNISGEPSLLHLELTIAEIKDQAPGDKSGIPVFTTRLKMQTGDRESVCQKDLKAGMHRKAIRLTSAGGQRTIFVDFRIPARQETPSINLTPQRLDLGVQLPGKILSKRIELINKGREMLKWTVLPQQAGAAESARQPSRERYFSFQNEAIPEPGKYAVPEHLKDTMEVIGRWTEKNGYPVSKGAAGALKFRFRGTGISVFLQSHTEDGSCSLYLDETLLNLPDVLPGEWEKKELLIAEELADGPHTLTMVIRDGSLELEGVKVFGREALRGPRGWITVFPSSGTTLNEKDYINVKVDTSGLAPGYYGDQIVFRSNAGEEIAEVFVDVLADTSQKVIDIFLYARDMDYLFTADPQAEAKRLIQNGYIKEGIAFRLFAPQTPGTLSFHRWYNPLLKDHYYHYDRAGGGKRLDGYVYEGAIGNIATSRLTNTRELYRWYNPKTGRHYYSTNPKGLSGLIKSYRFDGIAGYVR
ncbi:MAG: hypothetical protein PHG54_11435 [Smithellaceae bacterium]|nr:hypothetical protein [Smithellaceae bacterium]